MGHNFRPDYLKLAGFARECGAERILALTATAASAHRGSAAPGSAATPCSGRLRTYRCVSC